MRPTDANARTEMQKTLAHYRELARQAQGTGRPLLPSMWWLVPAGLAFAGLALAVLCGYGII